MRQTRFPELTTESGLQCKRITCHDQNEQGDVKLQSISQYRLILASSSPRRQELIRLLKLPYDIRVSRVDERIAADATPEQIVHELSVRKAQAVHDEMTHPERNGIIIGADTVVVFDKHILRKPKDERDAFQMLDTLQGNTHHVYSGVACIDAESGRAIVDHCVTAVMFKPLSARRIKRYIATGEPYDKAGAYAIQGLGATLIEKIEGDYFNVVGLPLSLLSDMLGKFGVRV